MHITVWISHHVSAALLSNKTIKGLKTVTKLSNGNNVGHPNKDAGFFVEAVYNMPKVQFLLALILASIS